MKHNVTVKVTLYIEYEDIEADSEEEAKEIAINNAREDIDFNNCDCEDDYSAYCWGSYDAEEEEEDG